MSAITSVSDMLMPDHLGSSSVLTNYSSNKVTNWQEYMPYGESLMELSTQDYNNPYRFNGKEMDMQTGLYYYGARYYDPRRSFWMSVDPLVEITMSPYAYTWNDPVNYTDPTGMIGERIGGPGKPDLNKIYDGGIIQEVIIKGKKNIKKLQEGNALSRFRDRTTNWTQTNIRKPLSDWFDRNTRNIFTLDAEGQARMDDFRSQTSQYMQDNVGGGIKWGAEHGLIGSGLETGLVGAFKRLNPNRLPFKAFSEMSDTEMQAFNHAISRHGRDFGLSWGKKSTLPKLVDEFNEVASQIRKEGGFMGYKSVKYGVKGSGRSSEFIQARVYELVRDGKTYYYHETKAGKFISAGLKTIKK